MTVSIFKSKYHRPIRFVWTIGGDNYYANVSILPVHDFSELISSVDSILFGTNSCDVRIRIFHGGGGYILVSPHVLHLWLGSRRVGDNSYILVPVWDARALPSITWAFNKYNSMLK